MLVIVSKLLNNAGKFIEFLVWQVTIHRFTGCLKRPRKFDFHAAIIYLQCLSISRGIVNSKYRMQNANYADSLQNPAEFVVYYVPWIYVCTLYATFYYLLLMWIVHHEKLNNIDGHAWKINKLRTQKQYKYSNSN